MLQEQTSTLAYLDVFFIISLLALTISIAGVFMSNVTPGAGGGGAGWPRVAVLRSPCC